MVFLDHILTALQMQSLGKKDIYDFAFAYSCSQNVVYLERYTKLQFELVGDY